MKKIITISAIALLALGLLGGVGAVLAHQESVLTDNSGPGSLNSGRMEELEDEDVPLIDNSGPGSLNSGRDEEIDEAELAEATSELEIKDEGAIEIKDAEVTYLQNDAFGVSLLGMFFHVTVSADTEFSGDLTFSDLMVGDIVDVEGMLGMDHHTVSADEVKIEEI